MLIESCNLFNDLKDDGYQLTMPDQCEPEEPVANSQEYYIPFSEEDLFASYTASFPSWSNNETITSVISVRIGSNNTLAYYDHWEDGYETDIKNPSQTSTQVFGDHNPDNGNVCDFLVNPSLDCVDEMKESNILVFRHNAVPSHPRGTDIYFDGGDYLFTTHPAVVSRSAWPASNAWLGGAVEVHQGSDWGLNYISPIGVEGFNNVFTITEYYIQARTDYTSVQIDKDGDGSADTIVVLNRGENHRETEIKVGGTITANKPVQVNLFTARYNSSYQLRWYSLTPVEAWATAYMTPVFSSGGYSNAIMLYNPDPSPLDVDVTHYDGLAITTTTITLPARNTFKYGPVSPVPSYPYGTKFENSSGDGRTFFALSANDYPNGFSIGNAHDWGYTLQPYESLSSYLRVGWAPGNEPVDRLENGSPIWITSDRDTHLCVDWDGDGTINFRDTELDITAYQSVRLYDPLDGDQTGMNIWSTDSTNDDCSLVGTDPLAAAWGTDAQMLSGGSNIDMGIAILGH